MYSVGFSLLKHTYEKIVLNRVMMKKSTFTCVLYRNGLGPTVLSYFVLVVYRKT